MLVTRIVKEFCKGSHPAMMFNTVFSGGRPLYGFHDFFWPTPPFHHHRHPWHTTDLDKHGDWMLMPVIPNLIRTTDMILHTSSPGYEIHQSGGKYMICVDLPGVKVGDMSVHVEEDGKVLHVVGGRQLVAEDGTKTQTKFSKRFSIGSHMDVDHITANLEDGVLTITAPAKEKVETPGHVIAITEGKADGKVEG
jgi:HSP20 family protein